jgi:predicted porin
MIAKKNLVAAAALMAVAAVAQADVKLYGTLDYSVGSFETAHDKTTPSRVTAVQSGSMMTSFFGLAGSEDLGGGLKAEFALESFLAGDTGTTLANNYGGFWGRASNVALSGGFGKVAVGQYDNPLFTSGYLYNPFGSSMTFSPTMRHLNYLGQTGKFATLTAPASGIPGSGVGFDTGWVNSLTYESPVVAGGLQFIGQFAPKETRNAGSGNNYTVAASYNAGPLSAMLTYIKGGDSKGANTAYTADEKVIDVGASYDFGVAKAFGQFTSIKDNTFGSKNKDKIYQIGVSAPVSEKATVMASYGELKNTPEGGTKKSDKIFSVGYDYVLSKRTDVYGAFMTNSQTTLESGQTIAVGIKHNF